MKCIAFLFIRNYRKSLFNKYEDAVMQQFHSGLFGYRKNQLRTKERNQHSKKQF